VRYSSHKHSRQQGADPSTRPEQPPDSTFTIKHVVIRVPYFWPKKPAAWFAQLKGQFVLSNITKNATKFYYVISQLDNTHGAGGCNIQPQPTGRYDRIKAELIRRLSLSDEQCVRQLLMHEEVGDLRMTHFLRHLRTLAWSTVPSDFLCTL
jgi:hypothetical protein